MLRQRLNTALKDALRAKDEVELSTTRLMLAALKDRDIAARSKGLHDGIGEDEILSMLQTMIKQRRESIALYERGGRLDLAERESQEMAVIERFLPEQMDEAAVRVAVEQLIRELDASSLKDMGRTMAELRNRYNGRMDFSVASTMVKQNLAS